MSYAEAYHADHSLKGKLRRRAARLLHRRPLARAPERPMLSISFDDAPRTAAVTGARLLEARGLRGTYYVSSGLAGTDGPMGRFAEPEDYLRLAQAGHEIACHTFSHLDCGQASAEEAAAEVTRNVQALSDWSPAPIVNFAYPYGDVGVGPKGALSKRYAVLRGLHHGMIEKGTDLNQAPAVGIEGESGEAVARLWLARARARPAWLILYTHDVRPDPSPWGCTPDGFAALIDEALADGFQVLTVRDAAQALGVL